MYSIYSILLVLSAFLVDLSYTAPSLLSRQTPQQYYLRTAIVPSEDINDTGTYKGDLYIQSYHTGAGFSDVTLTPNITEALPGFLNITDPNTGQASWNTNITIALSNETVYWEMCTEGAAYTNWAPMSISIIDVGASNCNGFFADGDLLMCTAGEWLVCDWWHDLPQLFYVTPFEAAGAPFLAPSSCSVVDLQMVMPDQFEDEGN